MKFRMFMKFRKLRKALVRIRLRKNNFYEDVIFESKFIRKDVEKAIGDWMEDLWRYKNSRVNKFKDLFAQLDEMVFPITIRECFYSSSRLNIEILDNEKKEYYMSSRSIYDYYGMQNYILGRRNSILEPLIDRDFHYKICEDGTITLLETGAMKLKPDGTNDDLVVDFSFDPEKHTTEANLRSYEHRKKIKIKYQTIGDKFDKMVLKELFDGEKTICYYYDVFPILRWIAPLISDEKVSISIVAEVYGEICSQIEVVNGVVQNYTTTQVIHEGETQITKRLISKDLQEFLVEK